MVASVRTTARQMSSGQHMPWHLPFGRCAPWCLPSGQGVSGHFPFRTLHESYRHRLSRQMSSERHVPRHLPSRRRVSVHYSFRTQSVKANVLRMMHATASAFWTTRTMASAFQTRSVREFFLLDAACVFQTQGVKADGIRVTHATEPHVQMQLLMHNSSRRSCQHTTRLDTAANAPRVRTQLPEQIPSGQRVSWQLCLGRSVCLLDAE